MVRHYTLTVATSWFEPRFRNHWGISSVGEHLPCKQGVIGSNPISSTIISGSSKKEMLTPLGGVERGNNRVNNSRCWVQVPASPTIYVCLLKFGRRGHIANVLGRFRREGSNPSANAIYWSVAQFGRAFGLGPRGRRFESCRSNHYISRGGMVDTPACEAGFCEFKSHRLIHFYRTLTQLVECCADIAVVIGSNPIRPTIILLFILIDICDWMCYD